MPTTIRKISGGNGWNAGGYGVSRWTTGQDHSLEYRVNELVNAKYLGVGFDNGGEGFGDADFAWMINGGQAFVYENFSELAGPFDVSIGQRLVITINSSDIVKFYIDSELKYTSLTTPTFPLGIDFSIFHSGEKIEGVIEDDVNAIFQEDISKVNVAFDYDSSFLMDMVIYQPDFDFHDFDYRDFVTANPDFIELLMDVIIKQPTTLSLGIDMKVGSGYEVITALLDMTLKASPQIQTPIDMKLVAKRTKTFTSDMYLVKPTTVGTILDMRLIYKQTVNSLIDMVVKNSGIEKDMVIDMILKKFGVSLTTDTDMVLKATYTKALILDMLIKSILTKTFSADMYLVDRLTVTPTIDMALKANFVKTFGIDMKLTGKPKESGMENIGFIRRKQDNIGFIRRKHEDTGYIRRYHEDSGVIV